MSVRGNSDNIGFALDIHSNAKELGQGDNAYIWAKPIEQVTVYMGRTDVNVLRGDACFGLWGWDRIGAVSWKCNVRDQEGWTFWDYLDNHGGDNDQTGISVVATPIEGLTLGVGIPLTLTHDGEIAKDNKKTLTGVYTHGAAYVGAYAIEGVGTIKAAVQTLPKKNIAPEGKPADEKSNTEIAAAFDLTAVENLFVSLGARIQTLKEANTRDINAYARYGVNEALTVHAIVGTKLNAKDTKDEKDPKKDGQFGFLFGAGIDYNLDGGIGLFADVRYSNGIYNFGTSADNKDCLTLGAGVTKGFSNGVIGVAFEGATNSNSWYPQKDGKQFAWEIPVKFEYWF